MHEKGGGYQLVFQQLQSKLQVFVTLQDVKEPTLMI